jgi:methanogenic corrinoid protein MtbC1
MIRYDEHAPSRETRVIDRGFARDPAGLAKFRVLVDTEYARSLSTLIENDIIPRLMVAHATVPPPGFPVEADAVIGADEIEAFAPLVMQIEADALLTHVEAILARGVAFDAVLVDLLAPTARLLGEFWEDERCDFVDVTMGLWRLQEVVHEISGRLSTTHLPAAHGHRALFASMPGDQHSFGAVVIDEIFRQDGWLTDRLSEAETADLLKCVTDDWFDLIGLTVSCDCHIATLPSIIAALRNVSRNPRVCVMVGGRIFSTNPDLAVHVGADGTARDAKFALKIAGELVRKREWGAAACN